MLLLQLILAAVLLRTNGQDECPFNIACPADDSGPVARICLLYELLCDGVSDCHDATDEGAGSIGGSLAATLNCSNYNGTQICSSGFEIPISYLCDGYDDCGNGEDEKHNLCIDFCKPPYLGGCMSLNRECVQQPGSISPCGDCIPGFEETADGLCQLEGPELYPFGGEDDDYVNTALDDGASPIFHISQPFPYFGAHRNVIYVNTNGVISFGSPFISPIPSPFPLNGTALVAPFWMDVDTTKAGTIFYRETNDSSLLKRFSDEIMNVTDARSFLPTTLFIATWFRVAAFQESIFQERNTFQVVMATDGRVSFIKLLYADIQWGSGAQIGFNAGDGVRSFMVPEALTNATVDIDLMSNINVPGVFLYRVDDLGSSISCPASSVSLGPLQLCDGVLDCSGGEDEGQSGHLLCQSMTSVCIPDVEEVPLAALCDGVIDCSNGIDEASCLCIGPELYPFGGEDDDYVNTALDDGASPTFHISQPFPYFGAHHNVIYVNTNGVISFGSPFILPNPSPFPLNGTALVAPFWRDVDTTKAGTVFYRETNDSSLLKQFSDELMNVTDARSFLPTTLFIATWFRVAAFQESIFQERNTFQVVMATDGRVSFIKLLYADIQWGSGAQIGFNAGDGVRSFMVPEALTDATVDIDLMSNSNVPGVFLYRVDDLGSSISCPASSVSLGPLQLCDGVLDCSGGEDEGQSGYLLCQNMTSVCIPDVEEVPLAALCDGVIDCSNGIDEASSLCIGPELYPFGGEDDEYVNTTLDDGASPTFHISQPFPYFGAHHNVIYVNTNGVISFGSPFILHIPSPFPLNGTALVAPFWRDVDTTKAGTIFYRETNDSSLLKRFSDELMNVTDARSFLPTALFIATWFRVAAFQESIFQERNTFQVVMATDGRVSFIKLLYADIQWGSGAQIGFNAGDGVRSFMVPEALTDATVDIDLMSNINIPGVFLYRVDDLGSSISCPASSVSLGPFQLCDGILDCSGGEDEGQSGHLLCNSLTFVCIPDVEDVPVTALCDGIANCSNGNDETNILCNDKCLPPYSGGCSALNRECINDEVDCGECLPSYTSTTPGGVCTRPFTYPYGEMEGDLKVPSADDGSSPAFPLSQEFPFFQAQEVTVYVNTNGILSFRGPFLSFSSSPFPLGEIPLVAPFWGDVDITTGGSILYRETQDPKLLQKFSDELSNATDATYFLPTTLFIATWVNVAPFSFFPSSESNTFQVVMATDGQLSFISFVYLDIQWGVGAQVGFNAGDGVSFMAPGALTPATVEMEEMSNINVSGVFLFHVNDQSDAVIDVYAQHGQNSADEYIGAVEVCVLIRGFELEIVSQILFLSTSSLSAQEGVDYYTVQNELMFFPGNSQPKCVAITIVDDLLDEDNETFTVAVSSQTGNVLQSITITIVDDDVASIEFEQPEYLVDETSSSFSICARVNGELGKTISVQFSTIDGTATGGHDFNGTLETLSFDFNTVRHCVQINLFDDSLDEEVESFTAQLNGGGNNDQAKIIILDNDNVLITFEQVSYSFQESIGNETVCVVVSGELGREVTVRISFEDHTAMAGVDYYGGTRMFVLSSENLKHCFAVQVLDDQIDENDELFQIDLSAPPKMTGFSLCDVTVFSSNATDFDRLFSSLVTVQDDDTTQFHFQAPVYIFTESSGSQEVCVVASLPLAQGRSLSVTVKTQSSTAQETFDYIPTSQILTFSASNNQSCVNIKISTSYNNLSMEQPEIFYLTLEGESLHHHRTTCVILESHYFYPYGGDADDVLDASEQHPEAVILSQPFLFFSTNETELYLHVGGNISFRCSFNSSENSSMSPLIVPLRSQRGVTGGYVHYRETQDTNLLSKLHKQLHDLTSSSVDFHPASLFIATWENVTLSDEALHNGLSSTFQAVLATNGDMSFVLFVYGVINRGQDDQASAFFSAGDGINNTTIPNSNDPSTLMERSNVNIPGVYLFRVDSFSILDAGMICNDWDLRIASVSTKSVGKLEVCTENNWNGLIVLNWDDTNADVACKQLGYHGGVASVKFTGPIEGPVDEQLHLDCNGAENTLLECLQNESQVHFNSGSGSLQSIENGQTVTTTAGVDCDAVQIGFESSSYSVKESDGYLRACVALAAPVVRDIQVVLTVVYTESAKDKIDYDSPMAVLMLMNTDVECVNITVIDDEGVEGDENFLLVLHTSDQAVRIEPQYAYVTIEDDDVEKVNTTLTASTSPSIVLPNQPSSGESSSDSVAAVTGGVVGGVAVVILIGLVLVVICVRKRKKRKINRMEPVLEETEMETLPSTHGTYFNRYSRVLTRQQNLITNPEYLEALTAEMVIPSNQLRLCDPIGQGEFGIVYKAHITGPRRRDSSIGLCGTAISTLVAVKTMKGFYDQSQVDEMMRESIKMRDFDHPNVLTLIGVCIDGGPSPYIVTPFMANGSLQSYLKNHRTDFILEEAADDDQVSTTSKRLMDMCHQIAKGMEYLASKNFVHRDLAARNCMIDSNFVIKVADFGLSESTYSKTYFREKEGSAVKLPIKWMALESLTDGVFSEVTDVWSYGVTCWEVFSGGKTPYPGVDPVSLVSMLENGYRMEKPSNAACNEQIYTVMLSCWRKEPTERPAFSDLVTSLSQTLMSVSDYMDFSMVSTFGTKEESNPIKHCTLPDIDEVPKPDLECIGEVIINFDALGEVSSDESGCEENRDTPGR